MPPMTTMLRARKSGSPGKVGPRIVRAWFDTVVNPLIESLEQEQQLLVQKNWTWRFRPGALEAIRETPAYVAVAARGNLEQFDALHPGVARMQAAHDRGVVNLSEKCRQLHEAVRRSPALQRTFSAITSHDPLKRIDKSLRDLFGAYLKSEYLDVLAEHVVNSSGSLPQYVATAPLWNAYRADFLAVLRRPGISKLAAGTTSAGASLLSQSRKMVRVLKETRLKLSLTFDVPYVERAEPLRNDL